MQCLLGNVPYLVRSPDEDWTPPTVFCPTCGKVLGETPSLDLPKDQLKEECPGCGTLLIETLQNPRLSSSLTQHQQESTIKYYDSGVWAYF